MIDFNFVHYCTGCGVCADACPKECIKIKRCSYGYVIPSIDKSACVDCGLCEKVCPVLKHPRSNFVPNTVLCAYHSDEKKRKEGSSGSMFTAMADMFINESHGVVYGAAMDDNLYLRHCRATKEEDLIPQKKSKYIQSDTTGVYKKVKEDSKNGLNILFVGTPCQCSALYNYLSDSLCENVLIVDFICHGVPSYENFRKSMNLIEKSEKVLVKDFQFREKLSDEIHGFVMKLKDGSGKEFVVKNSYRNQPFYRGFKSYVCFRESCYHCEFCGTRRVSDITIGDFWGIEKVEPTIKDFNKGYSMVIYNSEKGKKVVEKLKDKMNYKEYGINVAINNNGAYTQPTKDTIISKMFRIAYRYLPYKITEEIFFSRFMTKVQFKLLKFRR